MRPQRRCARGVVAQALSMLMFLRGTLILERPCLAPVLKRRGPGIAFIDFSGTAI